jgi:hypothetical protein
MEIYLSPELMKQDSHVLNIIDQNGKAVGYVTFLLDEKKMYVYGQLEEEGVGEDFKDLIQPYIKGMSKTKQDLEVYSYLSVGGQKIDLEKKEEKS